MGLYQVLYLCLCFWDFEMGTMLANFHICGIMFFLGAVLNKLVLMGFSCRLFSLSGPCILLYLLCFMASWN